MTLVVGHGIEATYVDEPKPSHGDGFREMRKMRPDKLIELLSMLGQRGVGQDPRVTAWFAASVKQQLSHQLDMSLPPLDAAHLRQDQRLKNAPERDGLIARQRLVEKPSSIFIDSLETIFEYRPDQVLFGSEMVIHHRSVALARGESDFVEADSSDPPLGEHRLCDGDELDARRFSAAVAAAFAGLFPNGIRLRGHCPMVRIPDLPYIMRMHYFLARQ